MTRESLALLGITFMLAAVAILALAAKVFDWGVP